MKGKILCFEPRSGKFFKASTDELDLRLSVFNDCLDKTGFVSFNDYLRMLSLEPMATGDLIGWSKFNSPSKIGHSVKPVTNSPYVFRVQMDIEPSIDYMDY